MTVHRDSMASASTSHAGAWLWLERQAPGVLASASHRLAEVDERARDKEAHRWRLQVAKRLYVILDEVVRLDPPTPVQQHVLEVLMRAAREISKGPLLLRRIPRRGVTREHRRRQALAQVLPEQIKRGGLRATPGIVALAAIALGEDNPCHDGAAFRERCHAWRRALARRGNDGNAVLGGRKPTAGSR